MSSRGWRQGQAHALLLATLLLLPVLSGCSRDVDQAQSLGTRLGTIDGVSVSEVTSATSERVARVGIILDRGLDAAASLAVVREVTAATAAAGWTGFLVDVRRSLVDDDELVVDASFASGKPAKVVLENWIRVSDALLGLVSYHYQVGSETIEVESGAGIGHDIREASRIGYGWNDTTWRFGAEGATYVVSGRIGTRDVALFDRVQRSVSSTVLPVPATGWRLERRSTHLLLDLDVQIAGTDPDRISVQRWAEAIRPLATAALTTTRYPDRGRWLLISDLADDAGEDGEPGERDTFASWSSTSAPVKGRDPHLRGWDQWWQQLAKRVG